MNIFGKILSGSMILISAAAVTACGSSKKSDSTIINEEATSNVQAPVFNADSAYSYVKAQVDRSTCPQHKTTQGVRRLSGFKT